jgi:hypothetical protein
MFTKNARKLSLLAVVCLLILAGMGGAFAPRPAVAQSATSGVALFGKVVSASAEGLVVQVFEPLGPANGVDVIYTETLPGTGVTGEQLSVSLAPGAHLALQGDLASLPSGTPLALGGTLDGDRFIAGYIGDLRIAQQNTGAGPALQGAWQRGALAGDSLQTAGSAAALAAVTAESASNLLSFNGKFESDPWSLTIPLDLSLEWEDGSLVYLKQVVVEPFAYLYYRFPFEFSASAQGLVLGKPGNVSLNVVPKVPVAGESFKTDVGVGIRVTYALMEGSEEKYTGEFTGFGVRNINATDAAPPRYGETIDVPATQCTDMWWIIFLLDGDKYATFALCNDIDLKGDDFHTTLATTGGTADRTRVNFTGSRQQVVSVTPSSNSVGLTLSQFDYRPMLTFGLYIKTYYWEGDTLTEVTDSESLTLLQDQFPAVPLGEFLEPFEVEQPTSQSYTFSAREPLYRIGGKGTLTDGGKQANLDLLVKELDTSGALSGSVQYIYRIKTSQYTLKSSSIQVFDVAGNVAVIEGKGTLNGKSGHTFWLAFTDKTKDLLALKIWNSAGTLVHSLAETQLSTSTVKITGN